ncbi:hypothetical protein SISSUDRAFT_1038436, partial [Sistotremastrum suecicum HHB10207 ss-3]
HLSPAEIQEALRGLSSGDSSEMLLQSEDVDEVSAHAETNEAWDDTFMDQFLVRRAVSTAPQVSDDVDAGRLSGVRPEGLAMETGGTDGSTEDQESLETNVGTPALSHSGPSGTSSSPAGVAVTSRTDPLFLAASPAPGTHPLPNWDFESISSPGSARSVFVNPFTARSEESVVQGSPSPMVEPSMTDVSSVHSHSSESSDADVWGAPESGQQHVGLWLGRTDMPRTWGPLSLPVGGVTVANLWNALLDHVAPVPHSEEFDSPHSAYQRVCRYEEARFSGTALQPGDPTNSILIDLKSREAWPADAAVYVLYLLPHDMASTTSRELSWAFPDRATEIRSVYALANTKNFGNTYITFRRIELLATTVDDLHFQGPSDQKVLGRQVVLRIPDIAQWVGAPRANYSNLNTVVKAAYQCYGYMDSLAEERLDTQDQRLQKVLQLLIDKDRSMPDLIQGSEDAQTASDSSDKHWDAILEAVSIPMEGLERKLKDYKTKCGLKRWPHVLAGGCFIGFR